MTFLLFYALDLWCFLCMLLICVTPAAGSPPGGQLSGEALQAVQARQGRRWIHYAICAVVLKPVYCLAAVMMVHKLTHPGAR
jgi:hypothetical protein